MSDDGTRYGVGPASRRRGGTRLSLKRWCVPCDCCGTPLVFLENPKPDGKRWVKVEIHGRVEEGEETGGWDGQVFYDPVFHVKHTDCPMEKFRLKRRIIRANRTEI